MELIRSVTDADARLKALRFVTDRVVQPVLLPVVERNLMPDFVVRFCIRKLLGYTVRELEKGGDVEKQQAALSAFVRDIKTRPIAENTQEANDQHYEVPAELFQIMLGPWLKYSSCFFPTASSSLEEAEVAMLELVCQRAELPPDADLDILDLGCGWGSCALFLAQRYPRSRITGLSNSASQREFIMQRAKERGLTNLNIITSDINDTSFAPDSFDRVVSNEMFEHMKNYEKLMSNIASWVKPGGKMFIHIFTHRRFSYHFDKGWLAEKFFTGGTMPGQYLLEHFQRHWVIDDQWAVNGKHYSRTLEAWLQRLDRNARQIRPMFTKTYGAGNETKWLVNWRLFNIACSEVFRYNDGNEWFVSHYRFVKR